jgi:5-bromo-4-chloroindolyl phosphate hydrolysis protein
MALKNTYKHWRAIFVCISKDTEIIAYFVIYAGIAIGIATAGLYTFETIGSPHRLASFIALTTVFLGAFSFLRTLLEFFISYTVTERSAGKSPRPPDAVLAFVRFFSVIVSLAWRTAIVDIVIFWTYLFRVLLRNRGDAFSAWIILIVLGVADAMKRAYLSVFLATAVLTGKTKLSDLTNDAERTIRKLNRLESKNSPYLEVLMFTLSIGVIFGAIVEAPNHLNDTQTQQFFFDSLDRAVNLIGTHRALAQSQVHGGLQFAAFVLNAPPVLLDDSGVVHIRAFVSGEAFFA